MTLLQFVGVFVGGMFWGYALCSKLVLRRNRILSERAAKNPDPRVAIVELTTLTAMLRDW